MVSEDGNKPPLLTPGNPAGSGPLYASGDSTSHIRTFKSGSLEEACDFISEIFCPHELKRIGETIEPSVRMKHAPLIDSSVNFLAHGSRVSIEPEPFKSFYLLQAPISGHAKVKRGDRELDVLTGQATLTAPDEDIWMDWSEGCEKVILRIDRTTLESMYQIVMGECPNGPLRFENVVSFHAGPMQSVWRMIKMISDDITENNCSIFHSEFAMNHMEQSILFALLNAELLVGQNERSQRLLEIAPQKVRAVEQYIHAHAGDVITIEKLVEISGISARTLFDNFKRFRGVTPMRYVKDVRMRRVRERLMNPKEGDTVTSVAMQWGFSQLGRFAVLYKEEFGESPSQTLKHSLGEL